jgi:CheY-like chemotaxis protein
MSDGATSRADSGDRRRILVVEDEDEIQILLGRILRSMGHEVESALGGAEAIEKIDANPPDLVLLDLIMPEVDGWEVLRHIRQRPNPPAVVVLTGRADYQTFARVVQQGASAYVIKPFRFPELVATCQKVLLASAARSYVIAERRRGLRRFLIVEVNVLSHDDKPVALGELLELSAGGARLELGVALVAGERVRLAFHLPGGVPLRLTGEIRWCDATTRGFTHGLAFVALSASDQDQLNTLLGLAV